MASLANPIGAPFTAALAVSGLPRTEMNETETEKGSGAANRWVLSQTTALSAVSGSLQSSR